MELGLFLMPCHPPERDPRAAAEFDLSVIKRADELGYREAWIGEHFTVGWEPVPAPDLLIAQALRETRQIVLAPGAHLLPYHQPVELAHRIAYLDQLAAGRYMLGVGSGSIPGDAALFGTMQRNPDGSPNLVQNLEMTQEALDILLKIWQADGPFEHRGKYWSFEYPAYDEFQGGPHIKPYQQPHPPIGMAGLAPNSRTLRVAGQRGFLPMSLNLSPHYLAQHWETYSEGAREAGLTPDRRQWRVAREFLVADTDEEALRLATTGAMGRILGDYLVPAFVNSGLGHYMVPPDADVEGDAITPEYLARTIWLVGSPRTVADRLVEQYEQAGGWGTLLGLTFDFADDPEPWFHSMDLMINKVMPLANERLERIATRQR
ncbi:LLM class flavin-dependent oxidoreductase [Amycolatopsis viridis]|uniref:Alkanesulfonate monooxygenase SsuD/methylene tetrahydromethanopterin reductase-like flavin-dependent oxidoreductase (Luciferase family) n=1 Tax=Amycolatopsis viridis TaxID=185678 RepID=A0ABX0SPB3_9PSEU|nr:LLM class flavin-dependent oxidoreductase [Amycolatopsis viridis]NIH78465.1 alkanesulfonate monooxygenase SsuD/methylene tetrahydromethanopterin reductase-like flavin-dependent oxidoreductase (luciferase family) [Amycolatopsis viridis]